MPDVPPPGSSLSRVMRSHFHDALLIRGAVIAGAPERAVEPARMLALTDDLQELPAAWRDFVNRLQQDARHITPGASNAQVAAQLADVALTCGSCHEKLGGPNVSNGAPSLNATTLDARMKRHLWASEQLWQGLVVPSSEAWDAGAKALRANPFPDEVLMSGGPPAQRAASDLVELVAKTTRAKTNEERATLYAELLVTCGSCHRAVRAASGN